MPPLAYSYQRFSSPRQAEGDSVRRQTEVRDAFLAKHGLALDDSLTFRDAGVSGFRGRHRGDRNDLGRFLALVREGRVPRGSYLIVESLDRLTREEIRPALTLLLNLIEAGVRIVQLLPTEAVYDEGVEPMALMMAIMELNRGHSESRLKSERVLAAWEAKRVRARESKKPVSAKCPAWLTRSGDRYELDPEKARVVRRLFEMADAGWGIQAINRRMVDEGVPCVGPSGRWTLGYTGRILRGAAAVGVYQPTRKRKPHGDPIPDYYPPVVTPELFERVRLAMARRRLYPGRHASRTNLFKRILFEAEAGDRLEYKHYRDRRNGLQYGRYVNQEGKERGGVRSFRAEPLERAILQSLAEITPDEIVPAEEVPRGGEVRDKLASVERRLKNVEDRMVGDENLDPLVEAARRLTEEKNKLLARLAREEEARESAGARRRFASLVEAVAGAPDREDALVRLQAAIRTAVERIDVVWRNEGRRHALCAQIRFRDGAVRSVLLFYRPPLTGVGVATPEYFDSRTCRDETLRVDVTRPSYRAKIVRLLQSWVAEPHWHRHVEPDRTPTSELLRTARKRLYWRKKNVPGTGAPASRAIPPPRS